MSEYEWLEKKYLRSVDNLRLWPDNPRLNPEESHINIADYLTDLYSDNSERDSFNKLLDSIVDNGFIPADPIVVWKNVDNDSFYVAEGNRRVLALKLLRSPNKAPLIARNRINQKSRLFDRNTIEKIKVYIAPSFERAEWYINQRHSQASLTRPWSRLQSFRWVVSLYDKHDGDIDRVMQITKMTRSVLNGIFRTVKIRDFSSHEIVKSILSIDEYEKVQSHKIPLTILERWFQDTRIKEKWGIKFEEDNVSIISNLESFLVAYANFLKLVINRSEPDVQIKVDTRTIDSNFDEILNALPEVSFSEAPPEITSQTDIDEESSTGNDDSSENEEQDVPVPPIAPILNQNPNRPNLIINCTISSSNYKLNTLFSELQRIPINRYPLAVAISLRVFLDVAIGEYIRQEGLENDVISTYHKGDLSDVGLKFRLEYLKKNKFTSSSPSFKIINKLINPSNEYSLDTLNNYIHGSQTHHLNKKTINGFWDFLFPLFEETIEVKEI